MGPASIYELLYWDQLLSLPCLFCRFLETSSVLAGSQIMLWLAFRFEGQVSQGCLFFRNGIRPLQLERRDSLCLPLSLYSRAQHASVCTLPDIALYQQTPLLRGLCLVSKRRLGQWQSSNEGWQESFERQNESGRTLVVYVGQCARTAWCCVGHVCCMQGSLCEY